MTKPSLERYFLKNDTDVVFLCFVERIPYNSDFQKKRVYRKISSTTNGREGQVIATLLKRDSNTYVFM